ncbi:MAG: Trk system potassium transporter TrkA [Magnetococcales bacterium]|nr:Trk system potassium transporter TrkA [Magnetococcales bacterium]
MNVVILGITPIGIVLAKYMLEEGHDIHVVDPSAESIAHLQSYVDVRALQGDIRDTEVLREAQIHNAQLVLAVTQSDTNNIVSALGLHTLAPKARRVIWVRDEQLTGNNTLWNNSPLEQVMLLTPERNALHQVMALLEIPLAFEVASFLDGKIRVAGFRLQENSPLIGKKLSEIDKTQENRTLVVAVERDNQTVIPDGDFVFEDQDNLYISLLAGRELSDSFEFMGLEQSHLRMLQTHYLIGGGGRMALHLAKKLEEAGIHPTIIEKGRNRCLELAAQLSNTRIIHGDVTDPALLQELIDPATSYIAVSGNQEINFMSSILARRLGAGRSITMFDNEGYIALSSGMGIDAAIHPNFTAIGQVIGLLRDCDVVDAHLMMGGRLEAVLIRLDHSAVMIGKPLHQAGIPKGMIIAAVMRGKHFMLPDGNTLLRPNDLILTVSDRQNKMKRKMRQLITPRR